MAGLNMATELRAPIVALLAPVTRALLLDPAAAPTAEHLAALRGVLAAYELLVRTLSRSSNVRFAFRDLPADEQALYEAVKHQLGLLERIHGPQAG